METAPLARPGTSRHRDDALGHGHRAQEPRPSGLSVPNGIARGGRDFIALAQPRPQERLRAVRWPIR
ncbi:hypothetical protein RB2654_14385 [Rhodobacterales bacterium HTCC2654]|uniref:Uncharacterized protein n=1 Tax=Maritimibacter alkaliphilus HTCC2654 TaxID=314271 RepID=A3VGS6_9RHOB|nr:hypothetical protein RB2654_14385 [Rhodobacterales bacterium HTCC2654] [Maritimibacter alkaliphilus HTCC2654]